MPTIYKVREALVANGCPIATKLNNAEDHGFKCWYDEYGAKVNFFDPETENEYEVFSVGTYKNKYAYTPESRYKSLKNRKLVLEYLSSKGL